MFQARCDGCGKVWRVPRDDRAFTCKECGGEVDPRRDRDAAPAPPKCPACGEQNAVGAAFCESCGAGMTEEASRARASEAEQQRRIANRDLGRLKKDVRFLRTMYVLGAVATTLLFILAIPLVALGEAESWVVALAGAEMVVMYLGVFRIKREPFLWAVVLAGFRTANTVLDLAVGSVSVAGLVITGVFWVLVTRAARVQKILDSHPDLTFDWQRRRSARGSRTGGAEAGSSRLGRSGSRRSKEMLLVVGLVVGLLVIVVVVAVLATRPPRIEDSLETFSTVWGQGDPEAIAGLFTDDRRAPALRKVEPRMRRRGYHLRPPALGEPDVEVVSDDRCRVRYGVGGGELMLEWVLVEGGGWRLRDVDFPAVRPATSVNDVAASFRRAWQRDDIDTLIELYEPEQRDRASVRLPKALARRGWDPDLPDVADEHTTAKDNGFAVVELFTRDMETVKVTWVWRYDGWFVDKLRLPKR